MTDFEVIGSQLRLIYHEFVCKWDLKGKFVSYRPRREEITVL